MTNLPHIPHLPHFPHVLHFPGALGGGPRRAPIHQGPLNESSRSLLIRDALKDNLNALYCTSLNQTITIAHMATRTISDIGIEEQHKTLLVLKRCFCPKTGKLENEEVILAYKYECVGTKHRDDIEEALLLKTEKMLGDKYSDKAVGVKVNCGTECVKGNECCKK
ncbi:hypothetical protein EX30DRAFT_345136 [Ascodesmis nigricans]|uniref:Uncharacterized protein n=1 Tax=Ascodesmis nigricans TaxID=341454 RepID=A0A4S2MNT5_9PEZI|nr:hypothetical protein EX30DRAFT_345136 [Ascodesmis nigricans]